MRIVRTLGIAMMAATTLAATVHPARAATTHTPAGGPGVRLVGSSVSFKLIEPDQTITCSTSDLAGTVTNPGVSRAYASQTAAFSTVSTSGCSNPIFGAFTLVAAPGWGLTVTGDPVGTRWPVTLTDVTLAVSTGGCQMTWQGTIGGRFNTALTGTGAQQFTPNTGASGLVVTATTGALCTTLDILVGDSVQVSGTWTNTPPSGSTSLSLTSP